MQKTMDYIVNDTNRVLLTYLFEEGLPWLETLDTRQQDYHYNTIVPILIENFESIDFWMPDDNYGMVPLDYNSLKKNKIYANILRTNINQRELESITYENFINVMESVEKSLREEIELRK